MLTGLPVRIFTAWCVSGTITIELAAATRKTSTAMIATLWVCQIDSILLAPCFAAGVSRAALNLRQRQIRRHAVRFDNCLVGIGEHVFHGFIIKAPPRHFR